MLRSNLAIQDGKQSKSPEKISGLMFRVEIMKLTPQEQKLYEQRGYHFPVRAFTGEEASRLLDQFQAYHGQVAERIKGLLPRERGIYMIETKTISKPNGREAVVDGS